MYTRNRLVSKELCKIFTLLNVQKAYIRKLLWKITWNNKFELERNIHFTLKKFYRYKSLHVSVNKILNHILFLSKLLLKFKKGHHHCVLFATLWMKRCCISSTLVTLQSDSGTRFNGLFLRIFTFLKSLHRVSSSDSLIKTEFSINQPFTTNFQALSVYVRRTWSCLFY